MHDVLCGLDTEMKDSVVLETYAWVIARSAQTGSMSWLHELSTDAFADQAAAGLVGDDDDAAKK